MDNNFSFTIEERHETYKIVKRLLKIINPTLTNEEKRLVVKHLYNAYKTGCLQRDMFGLNPIVTSLQTALIATEQIGFRYRKPVSKSLGVRLIHVCYYRECLPTQSLL